MSDQPVLTSPLLDSHEVGSDVGTGDIKHG